VDCPYSCDNQALFIRYRSHVVLTRWGGSDSRGGSVFGDKRRRGEEEKEKEEERRVLGVFTFAGVPESCVTCLASFFFYYCKFRAFHGKEDGRMQNVWCFPDQKVGRCSLKKTSI